MTPLTAAESDDWFSEHLADSPIVVILRGLGAERSLRLATEAWKAGIQLIEVPVQTPDDIVALRTLIQAPERGGRPVGAGTITTPERLAAAAGAGARFTIGPGVNEEVLAGSLARGLPHLPGVATPTDINAVVRRGMTWVKAFPASVLTPQWVAAMRGPFPEVRIVATGGVTPTNAASFMRHGAAAVAIGSSAATEEGIAATYAAVTGAA